MLSLAWRNLGRNPRRSTLTALAIGFAVMVLVFAMSMQTGQYAIMIDNATRLASGHLQLQAADYLDNPRLAAVVEHARDLTEILLADPAVAAAFPRLSTFALASHGERSYGAGVAGVVPDAERTWSSLPSMVESGRYLAGSPDEAVIGSLLARNLGVTLNDELVILGTTREGSIAALAPRVVGIISTGIDEFDRSLLQVPIDAFRDAFELDDEASAIVVMAKRPGEAKALAASLSRQFAPLHARAWPELMPELEQAIEVDRVSAYFIYLLLGIMVTFSIVNTFIMTVFERTRELGMLMAIGLTPGRLQVLMQAEAALLCLGGVLLGAIAGTALVLWLHDVGIPLGDVSDELVRRFHMPTRMYPAFDWFDLLIPSLLMLAATQIAAFLPTLRIRKLQPMEALRAT
ncbi:MAG: FtsX-like permease family protein [Pseudomonadales bacterium]